MTLVNLLLELGHFIFIEKDLELSSFGPASNKQVELFNNLTLALDDLVMKLGDHLVLHNIIKEGVWNVLLCRLLMHHLLKDLAESVPPSSEPLG